MAVKKLTDEAILKEVALHDTDENVRKAAVEKLTDETILVDVVNNTNDDNIAIAAIQKLSKEALKKVENNNWYIKVVINDILS